MYCWYCGAKLPAAGAYCHRCGQSQAEDAVYDPAARPLVPAGWPWETGVPAATEPVPAEQSPAATDNVALEAVEAPASDGEPRSDAGSEREAEPALEITSERRGAPVNSPPVVVVDVASLPPVRVGPPVEAVAADRRVVSQVAGVLGLICGGIVVAGSLGPWVTATLLRDGRIEIHGSEGDGRFTLWCGLAATVCLLVLQIAPRRSVLGLIAAGAFFLAAVIGIADWSNVSQHMGPPLGYVSLGDENELFNAEVGWGLQAVTIGGLAGTLFSMIQAMQARRSIL